MRPSRLAGLAAAALITLGIAPAGPSTPGGMALAASTDQIPYAAVDIRRPDNAIEFVGEDLNDAGTVVGVANVNSDPSGFLPAPFSWSASTFTPIPAPAYDARAVATDGTVVGMVSDQHAYSWKPGSAGLTDLSVASPTRYSRAWGVSPSGGIVVGDGYSETGAIAWRWTASSGMTLLPTGQDTSRDQRPADVNDAGVAVGSVSEGGSVQAAAWFIGASGGDRLLRLPSGGSADSFASAVNSSGVIVGWANGPVAWTPDGEKSYGDPVAIAGPTGYQDFSVGDVNDSGDMVGWARPIGSGSWNPIVRRADGTFYDLLPLLGGASFPGYRPRINNLGQVLVIAYAQESESGRWHTFLLTPTTSTVTCTPGGTDTTTTIPFASTVTCSFQSGAGKVWDGWEASHFTPSAATPVQASFTASLGGAGWIRGSAVDMFTGAVESIVVRYTISVTVPTMALPFNSGKWYFTGGPHCDGGAPTFGSTTYCDAAQRVRYAVDFAPPKTSCSATSSQWVTPAAPGVVRYADATAALVQIDHDGGFGTGYLHLKGITVKAGDTVSSSTKLGHPSCLGGDSTGTHVHFYVCNEPLDPSEYCHAGAAADTSVQIAGKVLGGWTVGELPGNYYGQLTRGTVTLTFDGGSTPQVPLPKGKK